MKKGVGLLLAAALAVPMAPAWAQEETVIATSPNVVTDAAPQASAGEEMADKEISAEKQEPADNQMSLQGTAGDEDVGDLQGVEIEEITQVPSGFALWWRGVRETLTLMLTWDEMTKAEKSLKFAEERMRIAQLIAEQSSDDEKAQEKARKMVEKAQRLMDKVENRKDKWTRDKSAEEVDRLVADIATHQSNSDAIMDEMEKKLSEGDGAAISEIREKRAQDSQRLLNAIAGENISTETKAHLEAVRARIEAHLTEVKEYNTQRQDLQEKVRQGVEGAQEDLDALKAERKTQIQVRTESVEEIKAQLIEEAAGGDATAQRKLDIIEKIQEKAQQKPEDQGGADDAQAAPGENTGRGNAEKIKDIQRSKSEKEGL